MILRIRVHKKFLDYRIANFA